MSYTPNVAPVDPAQVPAFLNFELQNLAQSLQQAQQFAYLQTLHKPPAKPREGLVVKADGTDWNPGSGAACTTTKRALGYRWGAQASPTPLALSLQTSLS